MKSLGGLDAMEKRNAEKGELLYGALDANPGFFKCAVADKQYRSLMNVTFRLPTEDLEKKFVADGLEAGFLGLKGHRSVGGIRVSMYNAVSPDQIRSFIKFMNDFAGANG